MKVPVTPSIIPIFMESFSRYFSIGSLNVKTLEIPKIIILEELNHPLEYSKDENVLKIHKEVYIGLSKEITLLTGWIGYFRSKVKEHDLIVNIAFCLIYETIDENRDSWLNLWKKVVLTYGTEILAHALWKQKEFSETISENLVNLLKLSINMKIPLSKNAVTKYLESTMIETLEEPDENYYELLGLILTNQTDNAKELTKKLSIKMQSYTTVTRKLQTIYDKKFLYKRTLPVLYKFGFTTTHVIISCSQQEYRSKNQPSNSFLYAFVKGYGTNFYKYYIFVTPNTRKTREYWQNLALKHKHNENVLIIQKYKEMGLHYSKEFWIDNNGDWSFLNYVLNDLASYFRNSYISDETLEHGGSKIKPADFNLTKDEMITLNAMLMHTTTVAKKLASTTGHSQTKIRERISDFKNQKKIREYFFPGFKLLPELVYLVINTNLVPYDNLRKFLMYLPYVGEETCTEIHSGSAWRLIYFYTKIGKTDDVINSIIMNFPLERAIIIRPQLRLGSYWQIPISLFDDETSEWNYNWEEITKLTNL